jgi:hypothetical protein
MFAFKHLSWKRGRNKRLRREKTKVIETQEGEVMSQKTIQMRAAEIRRRWSRGERKTRAAMGERRCLELLFQAGLVRPCFAAMRRAPA